MPGKSTKTQRVSIRLSISTIERITGYINKPRSDKESVALWCQNVCEREAWKKH